MFTRGSHKAGRHSRRLCKLEPNDTNNSLHSATGKGKGTRISGAVTGSSLRIRRTAEFVIATGDKLTAVIVYWIFCNGLTECVLVWDAGLGMPSI